MAGIFQNFIAGQQAGQARQEFTQGQDALARQQQFNQLASQYLGTDTVQSLGVPTTGAPAAQAQTQQPVDESQGPPQYAQQAQAAPAAPQLPDMQAGGQQQQLLSQLVALDPGRALELEKVRTGRAQQQQGQIYNLATRALDSGKPAAMLKYLLSADTIGGLNIKAVREGMQQQGVDINAITDEQATTMLQSIQSRAAAGAGIQPDAPFNLGQGDVRFSGGGRFIAGVPGKPQIPDAYQGYLVAQGQGYPGSFLDYQVMLKRAGAQQINLPETKYPNKFQEGLAGIDVERLSGFQKLADSSRSLSQSLDELGAINETAVSGGGANAKIEIANWIKGITGADIIDPKVLAQSQKYGAILSKVVLDSLGGSLGPGVSNSDVAFIYKTVPQLEYSRAARDDLIQFMKRKARQNMYIAEDARNYAENTDHKGLKGYRPPKIATNRATGHKLIQISGKWVDLDADPEAQ